MIDRKGDRSKQTEDCGINDFPWKCPNMRCTYEGMDGERWRCEVCGESYFLDYEDMK